MDSEQPKFRGKDATECENFIAAILKHAFSQGKQRDDQWMADFAVTCLANDALRWWGELDENVQGSWKLLQRAMLLRFRPLFYGGSGEEAENFIRAVCDKAIDKGKQEDNKWIAMYASSCFAGEALRWYASLDSGTQEDWKKLQQAVLVQYPRATPNDPLLKTVPTPTAASAPKASRRGRIRLSSDICSTPHYLSKYLVDDRVSFTSSLANALKVEWNPDAEGPQILFIPDSQVPGYDVLGVKWSAKSPTASYNILGVCAVNSQKNSTAFSAFLGDILTNVWKISSQGCSTGSLTVSAVVSGEEFPGRWNDSRCFWFAAKNVDSKRHAEVALEPV